MQTADSQIIVKRFFDALDYLKEQKTIRGHATFAKRYGINRLNMYSLQKHPEKGYFQSAWLSYLVNDYGISAEWLLTGKGAIK